VKEVAEPAPKVAKAARKTTGKPKKNEPVMETADSEIPF
jgi:hypothetical protein